MGKRKDQLVFTVSSELNQALRDAAGKQGLSLEELFRRAIAVELWLWEHQDAYIVMPDPDPGEDVTVVDLEAIRNQRAA